MDFVEQIAHVTDERMVVKLFHEQVRAFGYETAIIAGLPSSSERFDQKVLSRYWPDEWYRVYVSKNYIVDDPVARMCRRTESPFLWNEAVNEKSRSPRAQAIMGEAREFNMKDGLCIPIYGMKGFRAGVSLGAAEMDKDQWTLATTHLIGLMTYTRLYQIVSPPDARLILSKRERDILQWTAGGKSAWEISCILSISVNTVNKHIVNATRKLDSTNKTQAVARALVLNEIAV
jgi:LuxR family transcriptional regulator, quorum-sensing system regulator BjaR1